MELKGFCTKESTKKTAEKYKKLQYNILGKTGFSVSEVGFGGYRIDIRSPLNREALKKAFVSGINILDTSSNYTNGNSELLIGEVLKELVNSDTVSRDSVVVVTKGGYIQGQNYLISRQRKEEGYPYPELVEFSEGLEHCIHPEFLEEQIKTSLKRIKIKTIDVFLLHNPEYYLKWAGNKGKNIESAREEYYKRIKKAFIHLEQEAEKGNIQYYGISSNTFTSEINDYEHTSLAKILGIANEISPNNRFAVIEFPMNFLESSPAVLKNQPEKQTLLEYSQKNNLGVLINRPLNALHNGNLIRLAEPVVHNPPTSDFINAELQNTGKIEAELLKKLKENIDTETVSEISKLLFIYGKLKSNWHKAGDVFNWKSVLNQNLLPSFHKGKNYIKTCGIKNEELDAELFSYCFKAGKLFSQITAFYENEYKDFAKNLQNNLAKNVPSIAEAENLQKAAIFYLRSTAGISSVLVGMTQNHYVSETVKELKIPCTKNFEWGKIDVKAAVQAASLPPV